MEESDKDTKLAIVFQIDFFKTCMWKKRASEREAGASEPTMRATMWLCKMWLAVTINAPLEMIALSSGVRKNWKQGWTHGYPSLVRVGRGHSDKVNKQKL